MAERTWILPRKDGPRNAGSPPKNSRNLCAALNSLMHPSLTTTWTRASTFQWWQVNWRSDALRLEIWLHAHWIMVAPCARIKVHLLHAGDPHGLQHDVQFPTLRTWRIFKRHDQVMLVLPHGQLKCEYNMDQRFHAFCFLSLRCRPTGQVSHLHPESAGEARMNPCWRTHNHDSPKQTPPFGRQQIPTALSILIINQG